MLLTTLRRSTILGAIAGTVAAVAIIAIAGFFAVMFAGAAGAMTGAVLGFMVGVIRAPLKVIRGSRGEPARPI
jgi:hypothetical protein